MAQRGAPAIDTATTIKEFPAQSGSLFRLDAFAQGFNPSYSGLVFETNDSN